MLSAYLGGPTADIITPDYKHGIRSMLREGLLLEASAKSKSATMQMRQLEYEAAYAPLLDPQKASEILRKRSARLGFLSRILSMELFAKEPALLGVTNLLGLYNALTSAGIIRDTVTDDDEETDTPPDTE